jgi:hypothetical protein
MRFFEKIIVLLLPLLAFHISAFAGQKDCTPLDQIADAQKQARDWVEERK